MKILVVEDDPGIAGFLTKGLKSEGYAVAAVEDGSTALAALAQEGSGLDLVLLDLGLPGMDGRQVLAEIKSYRPTLPIIILTARDDIAEKVWGLDAGADDYVTKPFAFAELLARIRATLRSHEQKGAAELVVGDLRLDLLTKVAWRAGQSIELAPREWALLEFFMRHPNHLLSRIQILNHVWDYGFDPGSNIVDVYVAYLRRKLDLAGLPPLIHTVRGAGYRLLVHDGSAPEA